ncbi:MAG: thioredoxin domain-containing protein [Gemmatimonadaceae bacterium]
MANKRVEPPRKRKGGVVKSSKNASPANRAFYIIAGAIVVLGIGALSWASTRPKGVDVASRIDTTLAPVQSAGYVMGSPTAKLEVTEFGDFECPQCGRFATLTEPDVRTRLVNTGIIRYRFIDYPLPMHANTWNASRAAACADEQGKFWEMHDAIFQNQDRWNGESTSKPDKVLKPLGDAIPGMNKDQFDQCVDTKKMQAKIQAHYKLATAKNLTGTPTFIFGDKSIAAYLSYDDFKKMTDDALAAIDKAAPKDTSAKVDTKPGVSLPVKKGE